MILDGEIRGTLSACCRPVYGLMVCSSQLLHGFHACFQIILIYSFKCHSISHSLTLSLLQSMCCSMLVLFSWKWHHIFLHRLLIAVSVLIRHMLMIDACCFWFMFHSQVVHHFNISGIHFNKHLCSTIASHTLFEMNSLQLLEEWKILLDSVMLWLPCAICLLFPLLRSVSYG